MRMLKMLAIAIVGVFAVAISAKVVFAAHNPAVVESETVACGETTFTAAITNPAGTHKVANMRLVVDADGTTEYTDVIPTNGDEVSLTVGPFTQDTTISWRVFGGGERGYDSPLWNGFGGGSFVADINAYIASNGIDWTLSGPEDANPFTTWHELEVEGCPPPQPMTKDECKNGGWESFGFRNQGLCIQYVNTGKDSR